MVVFEDIQDVEEWLEPLGYCELWEALAPYDVFSLATRDHCDAQIVGGKTEQSLVLSCLKIEARLALTQMFGLTDRILEPPMRKYLLGVH